MTSAAAASVHPTACGRVNGVADELRWSRPPAAAEPADGTDGPAGPGSSVPHNGGILTMTSRSPRRILQYEHRSQPLLPRRLFIKRVINHGLLALAVVGVSLAIGVLGYRAFAGLSWIDALMNAAMILGGMGPVNPISTVAGKLFASFYALYAGVAFLAIAAVLIAPFAHRLLHTLHLEDFGEDG